MPMEKELIGRNQQKYQLTGAEAILQALPDYGCFENINNDRIICFNVSKTFLLGERTSLYECVRKYWRLNKERAQNANLVFAVCKGIIIGVF